MLHGRCDQARADLDAAQQWRAPLLEPRQQVALAAAEIEHGAAGRNQIEDAVVLGALPRRLRPGRAELCRHQWAEGLDVVRQQKAIVPTIGFDLAIGNGLAECRHERDELARLARRKKPVARKRDEQPITVGGAKRLEPLLPGVAHCSKLSIARVTVT